MVSPGETAMSRRIAKLLDESEKAVTKLLEDLEHKNGYPSHDARHIAAVHQQVRHKIEDLQLDPDDTTAQELFQALRIKYQEDCQQLDDALDLTGKDSEIKISAAYKMINDSAQLPRVWTLKTSEAKKLLHEQPPKHVMKLLRFRSVDSLMKRRDIGEILIAAHSLESGNWHRQYERRLSKLNQSAFELRQLRLVTLDAATWSDDEAQNEVTSAEEYGVLAAWPSEEGQDNHLLSIILALMTALQEFGVKINLDKLLDSHRSLDIRWWAETAHMVADLEGGTVSLNLHDVATDHAALADFSQRSHDKARYQYWHGLLSRYENMTDVEEMFDHSVIQKVKKLRLQAPEPVFEYEFAEDL
ncbi:hypothetical protein KW792_01570 [Candidatus Saccharibacteria bacterium]|nr:hypothetical protein [Candidatus Saccharibacteria bacterium]